MTITVKQSTFVGKTSETIGLSQMFTATASATNFNYIVLTALDRNEYTDGATEATGTLSGNGHTAAFSTIGGDGRGVGIVFTYQASTGQYYNSTYGYFNQLTYTSSGSLDDVTSLSVFETNNLSSADAFADNAYDMMIADPGGYAGSVTVATEPAFTGTVPPQATPDSIVAVADSFVGKAWNMDGCWVLASTIAAEAGASLPVQSTAVGTPGAANGEWLVAFNGPAGQSGNWESLVKAGEIIVIGTAGGGGHVTTCVSGAGTTAMLVDNITYENGSGQITNAANDGSASDVLIAAPHAASVEWAQVSSATTVVIYELDTPVVTAAVSSKTLAERALLALAPLFSAADPAGKAITDWQVYDSASSDSLVVNGADDADHSAATALTVASLASVSLLAGATATTDTLEVRAYNGSYWGDWTSLSVAVSGTTSQSSASSPVVAAQTPSQTWKAGSAIDLVLPATTFRDPQNQTLTYTATQSDGQALPSWLVFNPATRTLTGTAPKAAQTLTIAVTAQDSGGLTASDVFSATVIGTPVVATPTATQTWTEGQAVALTLPANTFSDPQSQALTYSATLANGQALPSWLTFHASTDSFTGTAPATAQTLSIKVTATDTSGLATSETFAASVVAPPPPPIHTPGIAVTGQTPNQVWQDSLALDFVLPSKTFTDSLGLPMTFMAFDIAGPNLTPWLKFNPTTDSFSGAVPANETGTATLAVIALDKDFNLGIDMFNVTFAPAASGSTAGLAVAAASTETTAAMMSVLEHASAASMALFHS
jgi:hypothetical protein